MEPKVFYQLKCKECGQWMDDIRCTYTELQEILKTETCPDCGGDLVKPPSSFSGRFRGTGFTKRGC